MSDLRERDSQIRGQREREGESETRGREGKRELSPVIMTLKCEYFRMRMPPPRKMNRERREI